MNRELLAALKVPDFSEVSPEFPHYHTCRPFGRARRHTNGFPCFDADDEPEIQHEGAHEICSECQDELDKRYPLPDLGHDDTPGGY